MTPSREDLARELAERNGECGHTDGKHICTQPRGHEGQHRGRQIDKVIPINDDEHQ